MAQLWEILVPTVFNDGRPIKKRYHQLWDAKVEEIAGGLTILKPGTGIWRADSGALFKERMIPVRVMCNHVDMQRIAEMTIDHYEQLAVMVHLVSEECWVMSASQEVKDSWPIKNKVGMKSYDWIDK